MYAESSPLEIASHKLLLSLCDRVLDQPKERAALDLLTVDERVFYAARRFEGEVNNGGFEQYFLNSAGDLYHESLSALKHLGAYQSAALLERAAFLAFDGETPPEDEDERARRFDPEDNEDAGQICDELGLLDDAFYDEPDSLGKLLTQFTLDHGLLTPFLDVPTPL